jgi:hypothetical protein
LFIWNPPLSFSLLSDPGLTFFGMRGSGILVSTPPCSTPLINTLFLGLLFICIGFFSRILVYVIENPIGQNGVSVDPHEDSIDFVRILIHFSPTALRCDFFSLSFNLIPVHCDVWQNPFNELVGFRCLQARFTIFSVQGRVSRQNSLS